MENVFVCFLFMMDNRLTPLLLTVSLLVAHLDRFVPPSVLDLGGGGGGGGGGVPVPAVLAAASASPCVMMRERRAEPVQPL